MDTHPHPLLARLWNLWAGERPLQLSREWKPKRGPRDGRWYVLLHDGLGHFYPWCYGTHYLQGKSWIELPEGEKADLIRFLKRLASVLPDSLWPDLESGKPLSTALAMCCDIRLLNFSLPEFDRPEVVDFISRSVQEARRRLSQVPEATDGHLSLPIADYDFNQFSSGQIHIETCWYGNRDFIEWPKPDILRRVPDAEELKQRISKLAQSAIELVPEASLLDDLQFPPQAAERRRPSFARRLDASTLDEAYAKLVELIEPAHDFALSVLQVWLDHIKGQACPLYEDNKRLVTKVADLSDQYGLRLFLEWKGELVEVRVDAKPATASKQSNPEGPAAQAGLFSIRSYDPAKGKSASISTVATFPPLVAARDLEQANRIWDARKLKPAE